ncbi:hypothetical protein [Rosistilla oblonga]|uniref:hypothetical protein n=1 Tax=Rosistilla oblonga TaxID=2527990 RepID=UPI003A977641
MSQFSDSPLLQKTREFVERVVNKGEFVEVMQDYVDDNEYVQIEGDGRTLNSKQEIIDFEVDALKSVTKYHGGTIGAIGVAQDDGNGNGVTMAEYSFSYDTTDGKTVVLEETQIAKWKNGKMVYNRYYFNPNA